MKKILSFSFLVVFSVAAAARERTLVSGTAMPPFTPDLQSSTFVIVSDGGKEICREATAGEAAHLHRKPSVPMHVFGERSDRIRTLGQQQGLNIILRGTEQLEAAPDVKAAFIRAAELWESKIASPITVVVDVDYGPTLFGEPFSSANVIGATYSAVLATDEGGYPEVRQLMLERAHGANEQAVYALLPATAVPTDKGDLTRIAGASALLRALGAIAPAPEEDEADGWTPRMGFNSAFNFDIDPSDGITPGRTDLDGVAVHEIGHMLGFTSRVGAGELGNTDLPSVLDLFRFRAGVNATTFATAQRILSSGGGQKFWAGTDELGLSTGRPDGTGGDENQASHWEDDAITGIRIGIMDPTLARGRRSEMTDADLFAFGMFGYQLATDVVQPEPEQPPTAPAGLTATALSATVIRLAWTDTSSNETEFRVEQKVGGTFTDIGPATANATTIDVSAITPGSVNTFRVRANGTAGFSTYSNEATVTTPLLPFTCAPDATTVCLNGNRFRVSIAYRNQFAVPVQTGNFVGARLNPAATNPDTAIFGFANPMDVEVVVRVVDARPFAPRFDLYYGGLTDVEYTVTVTDSVTGNSKTYRNNPGQVGGGVDRTTFPAN